MKIYKITVEVVETKEKSKNRMSFDEWEDDASKREEEESEKFHNNY